MSLDLDQSDCSISRCAGHCQLFEEPQIGGKRFRFFTGCPKAKTCHFMLHGGAEKSMEEAVWSLHDAVIVIRRATEMTVAGGRPLGWR